MHAMTRTAAEKIFSTKPSTALRIGLAALLWLAAAVRLYTS